MGICSLREYLHVWLPGGEEGENYGEREIKTKGRKDWLLEHPKEKSVKGQTLLALFYVFARGEHRYVLA